MPRALVIAFALAACTPRLHPGGALTPKGLDRDAWAFPELVALHRAVNGWNEAVPALGLRLTPADGTWTIERYDYGGERYGRASRVSPVIRVDAGKLARDYPRAPLEHLTATVMHEIAHALGLRGHLPGDAPDLLRAYHSGAACVDARTLAWLLRERPELAPGARATCPAGR